MGEQTGIAWTDSTMNFWEGCTKVGPGCDHCYAADRDIRWHGGSHWGAGAPRRQMSEHTRNNPKRWQRDAPAFLAEHGHRRRVFCSSLADVFDNEVDPAWRAEAFAAMEASPDLLWQICTKRISNVAKMIPEHWHVNDGRKALGDTGLLQWPKNVGLLITTVTPEEIARDVPRLVTLKRWLGIPWVGLSIEPMIADVTEALLAVERLAEVDWAIFGGESGPNARACHIGWITFGAWACERSGVKVFVKQLGAKPFAAGATSGAVALNLQDPAGKDPDEWPLPGLRVREFPAALDG